MCGKRYPNTAEIAGGKTPDTYSKVFGDVLFHLSKKGTMEVSWRELPW